MELTDYLAAAVISNLERRMASNGGGSLISSLKDIRDVAVSTLNLASAAVSDEEMNFVISQLVDQGVAIPIATPHAQTRYSILYEKILEFRDSKDKPQSNTLRAFMFTGLLGLDWLQESASNCIEVRGRGDNPPTQPPVGEFNPIDNDDDWVPLEISWEEPESQSAILAIDQLIEVVRGSNGYAESSPIEYNVILSTITSGRDQISRSIITRKQIFVNVIEPSRYLLKKFGDSAIGVAAKYVIEKLLGIIF